MLVKDVEIKVIKSKWGESYYESGIPDIEMAFNIRKKEDGNIVFNCAFNLLISDEIKDVIQYHIYILNIIDNSGKRPTVDDLLDVFDISARLYIEKLREEFLKNNRTPLNVGSIAVDRHTAKREIVILLNEKFQ